MKNPLISFLLVFVLLSISLPYNVYAQCLFPEGTSTTTYTDIAGCTWRVDFCWTCSITGASPSSIGIVHTYLDPPTQTGCIEPTRDELITYLINYFFNSVCTIPDCLENDPDCDHQVRVLTIRYPLCWQWHIFGKVVGGVWSFTKWKEPCEGGLSYCEIQTAVCRDPVTTIIHKCNTSTIQYYEYGTPCSTVVIAEPDDPAHIPSNLGNHTYEGCFKSLSCP
ncbi:MAG: hypothetical protein JST20_12450 [Bacteroidetes bacterium]|nr:hypothetical protein [Bacteroidota bacterium]